MGLTYDGITYRSLEEQVRYDAEQVQLLKQADVTINENLQSVNESLQTVNTELNGKLTKPANPSADSAVTMLADGTVGTKPLSEIGGGGSGGKLYRHAITLNYNTDGDKYNFCLYASSITPINSFNTLISQMNNTYISASYINGMKAERGCVILRTEFDGGLMNVYGTIISSSAPKILNKDIDILASSGFTVSDTVTEL